MIDKKASNSFRVIGCLLPKGLNSGKPSKKIEDGVIQLRGDAPHIPLLVNRLIKKGPGFPLPFPMIPALGKQRKVQQDSLSALRPFGQGLIDGGNPIIRYGALERKGE